MTARSVRSRQEIPDVQYPEMLVNLDHRGCLETCLENVGSWLLRTIQVG